MKKLLNISLSIILISLLTGCDQGDSSDQKQQTQQEQMLKEAMNEVGMPNIKNFREKKLLKTILELRDDANLVTYAYNYSEMTGKYTFIGQSFGYPIPYSTQFTNPSKIEYQNADNKTGYTYQVLPQADPNGLFSPATADGTWLLMPNPITHQPEVQYQEPKVAVFTYKLPANLVIAGY